jgi:tRNA (cytidine56-2'-O)-methyltransferase
LKISVLRWGHRQRDYRVTTHVALTARAFGASQFLISDAEDKTIKETIKNMNENWGGEFDFKMGISWRSAIEEWRNKGGIVVHLTIYGENIENSDVLDRIKSTNKNIMILIGSKKVPPDFFSEKVSNFNVAIGNQPHSEVAALAVFLDRLLNGTQLGKSFEKARIHVIPSKYGKKVIENTSNLNDKNL